MPVKPPLDVELDTRIAQARTLGNVLERRVRDDDRALVHLRELQARLRGAINALPQVRDDVFAACDALERFAKELAQS